jgi:hypothetical protein
VFEKVLQQCGAYNDIHPFGVVVALSLPKGCCNQPLGKNKKAHIQDMGF